MCVFRSISVSNLASYGLGEKFIHFLDYQVETLRTCYRCAKKEHASLLTGTPFLTNLQARPRSAVVRALDS